MKPTVGRIVHYLTDRSPVTPNHTWPAPSAAIITGVNDDGTVNLAVFPDRYGTQGQYTPRAMGVPQLDEGLPIQPTCWCWPPREG